MSLRKHIVNHMLVDVDVVDPHKCRALAHYWPMTERAIDGDRQSCTDIISGVVLENNLQDKPWSSADEQVATVAGNPLTTDDGGFHRSNQMDLGGIGADPNSMSKEMRNMGSDDFLYFVVGNHLSTNASGTFLGLGNPFLTIGGNPSFLAISPATISSNSYTGPVNLVKDRLSNFLSFPQCAALSDGRFFGLAAPKPGAREPYICALYRNGTDFTRRIVAPLTGEVLSDTVDGTTIVGDIQPNAEWFWFDFITYGIAMFHFTQGLPANITDIIDSMGQQWCNEPLNKRIHKSLLDAY